MVPSLGLGEPLRRESWYKIPLPRTSGSTWLSMMLTHTTGAQVFYDKACLSCHDIAGYGGRFGPDLTYVGDRLHPLRMQEFIFTGARNMPSYLDALTVEEMQHLMAFLESRRRNP